MEARIRIENHKLIKSAKEDEGKKVTFFDLTYDVYELISLLCLCWRRYVVKCTMLRESFREPSDIHICKITYKCCTHAFIIVRVCMHFNCGHKRLQRRTLSVSQSMAVVACESTSAESMCNRTSTNSSHRANICSQHQTAPNIIIIAH